MTKFAEWLAVATVILSFWVACLTEQIKHPILVKNWTLVVYFPIILIGLFGIYAVTVILWRVYTFNDCEEAAKELKEQIELARKDLTQKGFKFDATS